MKHFFVPCNYVDGEGEVKRAPDYCDGSMRRYSGIEYADAYRSIGPKALVGAFVHIESLAFIGQASVLVSHKAKKIGSNALIGAGAVVVTTVDEYHVVVGQPAKTIKVLDN